MPPTEKPLRLESSLTQSHVTVNWFVEQAIALPVAACAEALKEYQEQVLVEVLGEKWGSPSQKPAPWACPKCESRLGFSRRGARPRKLRTSFGVVIFRLRQITCLACDERGICTTFSPFPELLELPARIRISTELLQKGVEVATRISYNQSSEVTRVMTGQGLSPTRIHAEVQKRAQDVVCEIPEEPCILLLDSTKVKAGSKKNGVDVNIAMAVTEVDQTGPRHLLRKTIAAMGVGHWASLKEQLKRVKPHLILVDGDSELEHLAEELFPGVPRQRCLWHVAHTFAYNLWRGGGLSKKHREELTARLRQLLHKPQPAEDAKAALLAFADSLGEPGHQYAQQLLYKAIETAFTHRTLTEPLPGGRHGRQAPVATSYIEREMREVNRRVDNGSRWTETGVRNQLLLRMVRRLSPGQWALLWSC